MAISRVASVLIPGGENSTTSAAIDTTGATLLVVVVGSFANPTLSDSKGNTWTALTQQSVGEVRSQIYYSANPIVGTGHTFTLTGASGFQSGAVSVYSGAATPPFDVENGASNISATVLATGSVTPTEDNSLIVAGLCSNQAVTYSINSSFAIVQQTPYVGGSHEGSALGELIQTTKGAVNPTWSQSSAGNMAATIAVFKAAAGGGATNYTLTADVGVYSLTGIDATLTYTAAPVNYSLTADAGAYALTGVDAGLTFARRLLADAGSYSLTGVDATLTYVPASGAFTLTADTGAYSLTGNDAGLTFARSMTADVGSYTVSGVDAGLLVGRRLTADTGAYSLAGIDADLIYTALGPTAYALTAETGSYVLSGSPAGLTYGDGSAVIDTHDGFWAKEWARIRAREKRKYQEEIQERVEEIQDEIAEVEQQIVEVKQAPKPKKATPARDFYAEQALIVEHLIARRNQLIDEEDEELLLLL